MYIGVHVEPIAEYFHNKKERVSTSTVFISLTLSRPISHSNPLSDTFMLS